MKKQINDLINRLEIMAEKRNETEVRKDDQDLYEIIKEVKETLIRLSKPSHFYIVCDIDCLKYDTDNIFITIDLDEAIDYYRHERNKQIEIWYSKFQLSVYCGNEESHEEIKEMITDHYF